MEENRWAEEAAATGEVSSGSTAHSTDAALLRDALALSDKTSAQVCDVQTTKNTFFVQKTETLPLLSGRNDSLTRIMLVNLC